MRKTLCSVLMISLLLLTGCVGERVGKAEQEALLIRSKYLELNECKGSAHVTADYGRRVYEYDLDVAVSGEETHITVTAPETVAGISARLTGEDSLLEYEELVLETGPLDDTGLTPVGAVPALLEAARTGYIHTCSYTDAGELRMDCTDPELEPGRGRTVSLWFEPESGRLLKGEISTDGYRIISCEFQDFTMG